MKKKVERRGWIYWIPRVLILVFSVLIFFFALFSGSEEVGLLKNSINALPWLLLFVVVWFAWNHERIGGYLFLVFGVFTVLFFDTWKDLIVFLIVSFPIILVGALFLLNYYRGKK